jgi:hypothetical protein
VFLRERFKLKNPAPTNESIVDRKIRIFGGGTDENNDAVFDFGEQNILLCFIETVDFVDKEQRFLLVGRKTMFGFGQDFAELFHALGDGRELPKGAPTGRCKNVCECGFTSAGRTVKDNGTESIGNEQAAKQFSFTEKMFLSNEFVQCSRTHPHGKRFGLSAILLLFGGKKLRHFECWIVQAG